MSMSQVEVDVPVELSELEAAGPKRVEVDDLETHRDRATRLSSQTGPSDS